MPKLLLLACLLGLNFYTIGQVRLKRIDNSDAPIDYTVYKKHETGELVLDIGFATSGRGVGPIYYVRGEYFINEKLSSRLNFFINSFKSNPKPQAYLQLTADCGYHFYQEKRWDVYAFLGLGFHRFRREANFGFTSTITPTVNSGVGGRYRITPTFGIQLEFGRTSTLGIYKSFDFLKEIF